MEKKADIDQQMEMSRQTIENLNEQIQQYSLLIAQKQDELEQTEAEEARLNKQYKTRLRAMEETGKISYWSILFGASSFSDLLDKVNMINEIDLDGNLVQRKYVDFTVNTDERICDGFYFATALKHMKKYLQHPERLDEPLDEVVKDVD